MNMNKIILIKFYYIKLLLKNYYRQRRYFITV